MIERLKLLIFDFDGVIVESVGIKTKAFRRLFDDYPDKVDEIVEFHLKNDGLSRYKKFDYIFANILRQPLSEEVSRKLGRRFSELVVEEIMSCPFVPGALEFLSKYHMLAPIYIASGTPEGELRQIVTARNLSAFFKGVYGSPATKSEISDKIITAEQVKPADCLFIGDTLTDFQEAVKVGIPFVARWDGAMPVANPFADLGTLTIQDLFELDKLLDGAVVG